MLVELGDLRGLGAQPARPGRPCWLDLASIGSLWLPLAPLLARFGLVWLNLAAPAALAGSIWLLYALLGAPAGSIWLPTTALSTRLTKKSILPAFDCFDAACLVRSGTFLHASNLVNTKFVHGSGHRRAYRLRDLI